MANQIINFNNAIVSVKDGYTLNESVLRETKVYAKLMLAKGKSVATVSSIDDFLLSAEAKHIRAELFIVNSRGTIIFDDRCFVNVNVDAKKHKLNGMIYVELEHPTLNVEEATLLDF